MPRPTAGSRPGEGREKKKKRSTPMKCTRCRGRAEVRLPSHNAAFCRSCFVLFFQRQVKRAVEKERMFTPDEDVLVAVSGGKDSLALWDVLNDLGYRATGLHIDLGIGKYSEHSTRKTVEFASSRGLPLIVVSLAEEDPGLTVPDVASATRRPPCSACGILKRRFFDRIAVERGFPVVATGHNLDDEAARLLGNVLHWRTDYLARQQPVLEPSHPRFVRKVKPLVRCSEYEAAVYAFFRGIEYVIEECPNSKGATQFVYKDLLHRLELASPGSKAAFLREFQQRGRKAFTVEEDRPPDTCGTCGMPTRGTLCSFCRLVREVQEKRERRTDLRINEE